jgi:hypothetical protein
MGLAYSEPLPGFLDGVLSPTLLQGMIGGAANLPHNIHGNGLAAAQIVKTGQGLLFGFTVLNTNAVAQFIHVFDATAVPANGTVPVCAFIVQGTNQIGTNWIPGRTFNTGIVVANSTTAGTFTAGAADCFFDCQYV